MLWSCLRVNLLKNLFKVKSLGCLFPKIVILGEFLTFLDSLRHEHARRLGERNLRCKITLSPFHGFQFHFNIILFQITLERSQDRSFRTDKAIFRFTLVKGCLWRLQRWILFQKLVPACEVFSSTGNLNWDKLLRFKSHKFLLLFEARRFFFALRQEPWFFTWE